VSKPKLHFAHANSYPAGVYRQFFAELEKDFDIQALDMHGHSTHYPVSDGWPKLVEEYISELKARYSEPVILVGHSLGGMLSLMVARARPDLVRCVVMLDAPVVAGWRALFWRLIKLSGNAFRVPPAKNSIRRRNVWPNAEAAYQHFAGKDILLPGRPACCTITSTAASSLIRTACSCASPVKWKPASMPACRTTCRGWCGVLSPHR